MEESKMIITILGKDRVGIVTVFAGILSKYQGNIEDVRQSILQDYFTMIMMADYSKANCSFQEIKNALIELSKELDMEVWVQRKKYSIKCTIFKKRDFYDYY
ncbi:MAG: ACT domain-containing protein [Desulfobacterales bacterium]|nr:ACT domain-containing protein [Desulfobacterales bacterium]